MMTLEELNNLPGEVAADALRRCCGSARWVREMVARRPFATPNDLQRAAEEIWWSLSETDWKQAFSHHPKIGDIESLKKKYASTAEWASGEQTGTQTASAEVLRELAECNSKYEAKFGYIFIVCATGKSAEDMLLLLKARLMNARDQEMVVAATEQAKITHIRLKKLLGERAS